MDFINGAFEILGAFFIIPSIVKLHFDKEVKGVSWLHAGFFTSWGFWNLIYYPYLGQWLSFVGGIALCLVNMIWLLQMLYYDRRNNPAR